MIIEETSLVGILILQPTRFGDTRGFFSESYNARTLQDHGIVTTFVQDNHSLSEKVGTIRGLHYQSPPHAQDKLVRCGRGAMLDVAVDIRIGSPTYGAWVAVELSFENGKQLLVPAGFAHGFMTLTPDTEICYKCSDYYNPATERAILWNDPDLAIDWPVAGDPVLSDRDANADAFATIKSPFGYSAL